jgi:hypothetical protein
VIHFTDPLLPPPPASMHQLHPPVTGCLRRCSQWQVASHLGPASLPRSACCDNLTLLPPHLQNGRCRLPDVFVTDKNDTFHCSGSSYGSFRLAAQVVRTDEQGYIRPVTSIDLAVSAKLVVGGPAGTAGP